MATNVYTYPFPDELTYPGATYTEGTEREPSEDLFPSDDLGLGEPPVPTEQGSLYPGRSILFAQVEDPKQKPPVVRPGYTVYVADTRTGRIGFELPYTKFSWSCPLNGAGTMSVTVPIDDTVDYEPLDERSMRNRLAEISTGPWRFTFALAFGGRVIWAGPLVAVKQNSDENEVEFGCVEIWAIFNRRLLVHPSATDVTSAAADTVFQNTTLPNIAKQLVNQAMSGNPESGLPIDLPDVTIRGGHQRFYYGYDLATYGDRLNQLTKVINGPDIRFDPYLVVGEDANYLRWSMLIGDPYLNTPAPYTWEHNVNASLDYDLDSKDMAFDYYTTGAGQDRGRRIGSARDRSLVDIGFPLLEAVDNSHASASEIVTLNQWAEGDVKAYSRPIETWTLNVWADDSPMLGEYRVGDTMQVGVKGHLLIQDGFFTRRMVSLSGDETGKVAMSGDSKPDDMVAATDEELLGKSETTEENVTITLGTVPAPVWAILILWGYTPNASAQLTIPRSTLAAAYQYQDEWVSA